MVFIFGPQAAVDITTGNLVKQEGLAVTPYATEADAQAETNPVAVTLAGGVPSSTVSVSAFGQTVEFSHETYYQFWLRSGDYIVHVMSFDGIIELIEAAAATAEAAVEDTVRSVNGELPDVDGNVVIVAGGGGDGTTSWAELPGKPDAFPPTAHTHLRSEISDISVLARALLSDADAQAMRQRIGAGTGNGTSNLTLGTTASTAAAGNHAHSQYVDAAQAADIADARIEANGGVGGGGGGQVLVWRYRSGAYPALPATQPAGVELVHAVGPLQPSVLPSWVGNGASQVPAEYHYNGALT